MLNRGMATAGFRRLLPVLLALFVFFGLGTTAVLYFRLRIPLSPHYGAAVTVISRVRETLARDVILTDLIFFALAAAGVLVLGVLYSHRVAGPLYKVRRHASEMAEGRFDARIRFRRKDAVHDLAGALNRVAASCAERSGRLDAGLRALEENLRMLEQVPAHSPDRSRIIQQIGSLDAEICAACPRVKR